MSDQGPSPRQQATSGDTDAALIERACRGEAEAFGTLVARYEVPLFNFMVRFCGNRDLARDLCQEAFLKAFRGLPGFRVGSPFKPWLYRVAINAAHSHRRRASRRETGVEDMTELEQQDTAGSAQPPPAADAQLVLNQDGVAVQHALAELPDALREAVVLKFVEDFTYEEMADVLGARVPALKMRVHRGLQRLRELLASGQGGGG
ncbi:MAG: RNA polymerase sigma factor [Myxococcota bacterium]